MTNTTGTATETVTINARGYGSADTAIRRQYPTAAILKCTKVAPHTFEYEIKREATR